MARKPRGEVFAPDEIAIVHVMNRVVRRCFLLGDDPVSGKNFDHRKVWIEEWIQAFAAAFGIDLLAFAILSNHFHLVLRSRPDVVATWDDTEVARRWLLLCPNRHQVDGSPAEPNAAELNAIRNCPDRVTEIRSRLSDVSWWMRLLCQRIATRANREEGEVGRFWQNRFQAVRILDEASLLACAAYVDLNPIRAALAETLEESDFTSAQRRIQGMRKAESPESDRFLSPLLIDERNHDIGPCPSSSSFRCSDKGFLPLSLPDYLELLDWTARQIAPGKTGQTPRNAPPIFARLSIEPSLWLELVTKFGRLFYYVAGEPPTVDAYRSPANHRFHLRDQTRQIFTATSA